MLACLANFMRFMCILLNSFKIELSRRCDYGKWSIWHSLNLNWSFWKFGKAWNRMTWKMLFSVSMFCKKPEIKISKKKFRIEANLKKLKIWQPWTQTYLNINLHVCSIFLLVIHKTQIYTQTFQLINFFLFSPQNLLH